MVYKFMNLMMRPRDGHTLLYIHMCLFDRDYVMDFYLFFMVILRSTTGPYGRPMLEVAYGEMLLVPSRLYER